MFDNNQTESSDKGGAACCRSERILVA